ncbi:tRNA (adenosine(37)-N6)-dimethylallyltransferase MiaA [Citromicrobium bathyomarinum]|uniref:tRNA (adenosine(37)-N6)-dimethylallyltransferase MiaA n=1 Tax=Sphingomonadales TaxID=204457 RepID=UPI000C3BFA4B|nr:tRNA (adenosine(37)-N6)-dimethylallyltransferase MiaA [Citromicrobium sp.]MBO82340.1 tRNA (adenosine(37)-N6)-dimethylallyltransferase MiaA [Citromicrobium sp.]|tara:strand:+ start:58980 stop:59951 length:972 start_codon:yes stop_codon:yes gene_type:complete
MSTNEFSDTAGGPLALIAGPTASGKSALALDLADSLAKAGRRGVIVNADSAQVYADLRVLSARPDDADLSRAEHRLFGAWDGSQTCSAADWAVRARQEIAQSHAAGAVPILVGGTGLYIRTLLDGIAPIPAITPHVRDAVRALPTEEAHAALSHEDPASHARLDPGDRQRIARALEVVRSTGLTLGNWQERREGGIADKVNLAPVILLPEREWLYARCDARFEAMLDSGAVAEVEALLARELDPDLPVMRAIGVREIAAWLGGEISRDEAVAKGQQATRNYAKRQYTWLRHQPPENWPRVATAEEALALLVADARLVRGEESQ